MAADVRIGFSTSRTLGGLLSKLICWISGATVSHAWLVYFDGTFGLDMVLEAHITGFRAVPFITFAKSNNIKAVYRPVRTLDEGLSEAAGMLGEAFDVPGLFGMIWVELGRRFRHRWRNPMRSFKSQFCSEAVVRVMNLSRSEEEQLDPETVSPGFLLKLLQAEGAKEV